MEQIEIKLAKTLCYSPSLYVPFEFSTFKKLSQKRVFQKSQNVQPDFQKPREQTD